MVPQWCRASPGVSGRTSDFFHFGEAGQRPGLDPERRSYATFVSFHDLDGNTWLVQEKNSAEAGT